MTTISPPYDAIYYDVVAGVKIPPSEFRLGGMGAHELEVLLGGPLEVVQLDADDCLLTNANARELQLPRNRGASQHWFYRHPESGAGADFVLGPVIYCRTADVADLDLLRAVVKPVLSAQERVERAAMREAQDRQQANCAEARQLCAVGNPGDCEMCGS